MLILSKYLNIAHAKLPFGNKRNLEVPFIMSAMNFDSFI